MSALTLWAQPRRSETPKSRSTGSRWSPLRPQGPLEPSPLVPAQAWTSTGPLMPGEIGREPNLGNANLVPTDIVAKFARAFVKEKAFEKRQRHEMREFPIVDRADWHFPGRTRETLARGQMRPGLCPPWPQLLSHPRMDPRQGCRIRTE